VTRSPAAPIPYTRSRWGPNHPDVAHSLNNLTVFYPDQGSYVEAEPLFRRLGRHGQDHAGARASQPCGAACHRAEIARLAGRTCKVRVLAVLPDGALPRALVYCIT
jgi:hypothetical protein